MPGSVLSPSLQSSLSLRTGPRFMEEETEAQGEVAHPES